MTNDFFVHESSCVDGGARIGKATRIWHFCHIMGGATVGENCNLGQNVFVGAGVSIGDRVRIQNNVSIYKGVTLEDDVFIGPSVVFTNVRSPRAFIEQKDAFSETRVEKGATIGANATIVCGSVIGAFAMVGAGAVVTGDVRPHALVLGNPARQVGWVTRNGRSLPVGFEGVEEEDGWRYRLVNGSLEIDY